MGFEWNRRRGGWDVPKDFPVEKLVAGSLKEKQMETVTATPSVDFDEIVVPTGSGLMGTLGKEGDVRTMWNRTVKHEVETARETFNRLVKEKKYLAFQAEGEDGRKGKQIYAFDPDMERIILVPPMVGG